MKKTKFELKKYNEERNAIIKEIKDNWYYVEISY